MSTRAPIASIYAVSSATLNGVPMSRIRTLAKERVRKSNAWDAAEHYVPTTVWYHQCLSGAPPIPTCSLYDPRANSPAHA